jgi:hypothetical protein
MAKKTLKIPVKKASPPAPASLPVESLEKKPIVVSDDSAVQSTAQSQEKTHKSEKEQL